MYEVQSTGSHISPFRRQTASAQNDILNRLVLHSLDKALASIDPRSKRVSFALSGLQMDQVAPPQRESVAMHSVVAELEKLPQRQEWDRIVVATPAYRALELNGLANKLQGFGLFAQPLCQHCPVSFDGNPSTGMANTGGVDAVTSEDETIRARTYIAPYSYIQIWVLDPKTLAVIDRQQRFDSLKLAEPEYKGVAMTPEYLVGRVSQLIDASVGDAVMRSEVNLRRGKAEVGEPRLVNPGEPDKAER